MLPADRALRLWSSAVAGIASIASLALSIAGARARDGRTVLMGMAFSTMTALFTVHALATPGFIVGMNGDDRARRRPLGAGRRRLLALTALPALRRPRQIAGLLDRCRPSLFVGVLGARR